MLRDQSSCMSLLFGEIEHGEMHVSPNGVYLLQHIIGHARCKQQSALYTWPYVVLDRTSLIGDLWSFIDLIPDPSLAISLSISNFLNHVSQKLIY